MNDKSDGKSWIAQFLTMLCLLVCPVTLQAQFNYTINNGSVIITGYTGSGGAVTIPNSINGYPVTSIGNQAFYNCISLTNVTILNGLTSIDFEAFGWCIGLTNITIPNSVTNIGFGAFDSCVHLINISVGVGNPNYASVGGVLFDKAMTTLIQYPARSTNGTYTVPSSVTSIDYDAFFESINLMSVTIPGNVTNIGNGAFENCGNLTNVTIQNGLISIGQYAFGWCNLTSVTIPNSVTSIGYLAFDFCNSLTNISVSAGNPHYASVGSVLFDKAIATLIQYPAGATNGTYTVPNSVTGIRDYAFDGCAYLKYVTIPNSVTNIGEYVFSYCSSLTNAFFLGNAPRVDGQAASADTTVFQYDLSGTVYYLPGTTGWSSTFGGWPTARWYQPQPQILGSAYGLGVRNNGFNFTISWATNIPVVVEASTNLLTWTPVTTNTLINGTNSFSDANWTNYVSRFYRVRTQ